MKPKIVYLDHVKVLMTVLVILHHVVITYGGPGGWYYRHPATGKAPILLMTLFVSTNQSFFMGLFFLLSAYFIESSLQRKGIRAFVKDRLIRLGIPMVFYSFVLSPVMIYLVYHFGYGKPATFLQFLGGFDDWIDFGVLWFAAALLLFTIVFVIVHQVTGGGGIAVSRLSPGKIVLFALGLGAVTFFVRLVFPVGWVLKPPGFQLGHFPQYISLFIFGILARRGDLAEHLELPTAKLFTRLAVGLVVIGFPLLGYMQEYFHDPAANFNGGWNRENLAYSFYEQLLGISIMVALTGISRYKWNQPSTLLTTLSRSAFAAYIFHPLVVIGLSLLVRGLNEPLPELAIVAPGSVISTFLLAGWLVKIPGLNKII